MARKPNLEGRKRDEIMEAAMQLFFTEGFESTSVRKILDRVGGEVGMFYHYFRSKEELFDLVIDRFFQQYASDFEKMAGKIRTPEELVDAFLPSYEEAMEKYRRVESGMHWTIRSALHERTVLSLIPAAEDLLRRFGYGGAVPPDIAAAMAVAAFSAAIHSESFQKMEEAERKQLLLRLIADGQSSAKVSPGSAV